MMGGMRHDKRGSDNERMDRICDHSLESTSDDQQGVTSNDNNSLSPVTNPAMEGISCSKTSKYKDQLRQAVDSPFAGKSQLYPQELTVLPVNYPPSTSSLLPLRLQLTLDAMPPMKFLAYIVKQLSIEKLDSLMKDEQQRKKTFLADWPHSHIRGLSSEEMARAAFYYVGTGDQARCVFCQESFCGWTPGDNPMSRHAGSCQFAAGKECGNIEYKTSVSDFGDLANLTPLGPCREEQKLGIVTRLPNHSEFAVPEKRKRTFHHWPAEHTYNKQNFEQTSFFYTKSDDLVCCFHCSCAIRGWRDGDNPWERHAQCFPNCSYLLRVKTDEFVDNVSREWIRSQERQRVSLPLRIVTENDHTLVFYTGMSRKVDGTISIANNAPLDISTSQALTMRFTPCKTKKATFSTWPQRHHIKADLFVKAGFYYNGFDDTVTCFYCFGSLGDWDGERDSDPWVEHARWFPHCCYLMRIKGKRYIEDIHATTPEGKKLSCTLWSRNQPKVSNQQAMEEFCLKLGHKQEVIDRVMELNRWLPYHNPRDMIEMIYQVEEGPLPPLDQMDSGFGTSSLNATFESTSREAVPSRGAGETVPDATCHKCFRETGQNVSAVCIGLPCGHLIYCKSCKDSEAMLCRRDRQYALRCPYTGCVATLLSFFRVYYV